MESVDAGPKLCLTVDYHDMLKIQKNHGNGTVAIGKRSKQSNSIRSVGAEKVPAPTAITIFPGSCVNKVMWIIVLTWNISSYVSLIPVRNFVSNSASLQMPIL